MKKITKISRTYSGEFQIDEIRLKKILSIIDGYVERYIMRTVAYRFTVVNSNKSQYETDNIDDVLKDDNESDKEIIKLGIELSDSNSRYSRIIELVFDSGKEYSYSSPIIKLTVDDTDGQSSQVLLDDVENQVLKLRKDLAKTSIYYIAKGLDIFLPLILTLVIVRVLQKTTSFTTLPIGQLSIIQFLFLLIGCIIAAFFIVGQFLGDEFHIITKFYKNFSHNCFFNWGDKMEINNSQKKLKDNILWVILVGAIVSILTGLLTNFLTK